MQTTDGLFLQPSSKSASDALHTLLPEYTFGHRYQIVVNSPDIDAVYELTRDVDMSRSWVVPLLFKLRGLPMSSLNGRAFTARMGWSDIAVHPPHEFVIGYWRSRSGIEKVADIAQFTAAIPGATQKVAFSFRFFPEAGGRTRIDTETRVLCIGRASELAFWPYWLAIKPFSGRIRQEILRIVKLEAETRARSTQVCKST